MFGSNLLDVVIGLVLVYLLLSLVTSSLREVIAGIWKTRAVFLEQGIRDLLGGSTGTDQGLVDAFYQHPRISSLYSGDAKNPSYIPARSFSMALMDMAARGRDMTSVAQAGSEATELTVENVRKHVGGLGNPRVQRMVLCAIDSAKGDLDGARREIEDWFNSAMDRVSGRYRRRTSLVVFILGAVATILLNVDSVRIATEFYKSPALREAAVAMAGRIAPPPTNGAVAAPPNTATTNPAPPAPAAVPVRADAALDSLYALKLPIGWDATSRAHIGGVVISSFFGWLITALAVTLGAPFWFDMLNRIMIVRSTVKPAEKSGEEGSGDLKPNPPSGRTDPSKGGPSGTVVVTPLVTALPGGDGEAGGRELPHEWAVGDAQGGVL